ncbi:hypothetical protein [Ktedonospora formicarum]|nr:hypothetical protein [Ktedonospora formicarum]
MSMKPRPMPEPEEQPLLPMTSDLIRTTVTGGRQVYNNLSHSDINAIVKKARGMRGGELHISFDEKGRMVRIRKIIDYHYNQDEDEE